MASSIIQLLISLLPRARALARCERGRRGNLLPRDGGVQGPELRASGAVTAGSVGRRRGRALKPLRSAGAGPVEKPRAARYLLMKWDDFVQLGRCSGYEVPFFGGAGRNGHRGPVTLGCFGPRLVSPLPLSPPPLGQLIPNIINQVCRVHPSV